MAEQKQIKRLSGFKDVYIAEVTENTASKYTTGTPMKLARGISCKLTDKFETEKIYSDDNTEDVVSQYTGTDIEIGINTLCNSDYAMLYNCMLDNGFMVKSAEDQPKEVALGFRAMRTDGTYDFYWLYCGKFTDRPEENFETKGEKINTQTSTIKGSFYARQKANSIDGKEKHLYECKVNECELLATEEDARIAVSEWFSEVQEFDKVRLVEVSYTATGEVTEIDPDTIKFVEGKFVIPITYKSNFTFKDGEDVNTATYADGSWTIA